MSIGFSKKFCAIYVFLFCVGIGSTANNEERTVFAVHGVRQKVIKTTPCGAKRHTQFKTLSNGGNKKVCFRKIPPKIARCTDRQNERGFFNVCLKNSLFVLYVPCLLQRVAPVTEQPSSRSPSKRGTVQGKEK